MMDKLKIKSYIKKYEIIISSVLVIIFVVILSVVMLIPNFQKANQLHKNHKDLKSTYSRLEQKDATLSSLDEQYFRDTFPKINNVLPSSKDYYLLFETFDNLQSKTGISISRTDFQLGIVSTNSALLNKPTEWGAYEMPISFEVTGTIEQLRMFMLALTDLSGRLITLENAQIDVRAGGSVRAVLNGQTYFYPLPKTIGKVDSPLPELSKESADILTLIDKQQTVIAGGDEQEAIPVGRKNLFSNL